MTVAAVSNAAAIGKTGYGKSMQGEMHAFPVIRPATP
jgi:hypothetical protein